MMLLDLICADCLLEQIKDKKVTEQPEHYLPIPFEAVNDSGIYDFVCSKGHQAKTYLNNINFEILFDYSVNAIADGYYREAVSSFTSAMERYFEFFIKVSLRNSKTEFNEIDKIWKPISKQSERQLGAYITLYAQTFNELPLLLNSNKEVPFRNKVIHQGYIPSKQEAINFGNRTLEIIESSLLLLKHNFPEITKEVFDKYGYSGKAKLIIEKEEKEKKTESNVGCVNILTTISVLSGREIPKSDDRKGDIENQISRILENRNPRGISLFKEMKPKEKE
jgi:hypothetical protein